MINQLNATRDRISRAEEHLETIKRELLLHYEAEEYLITGEYQRDFAGLGGQLVTDQTTTPEIDARLNTIVGEYLHDLRSGLDHLAWQLVLENKGTPTEKTRFPIKDGDPGTDKKGGSRAPVVSGGVSVRARALIRDSQPYRWRSHFIKHPLWLLHQLWNIDKHRYVIAKGTFGQFIFPVGSPTFRFTSKLDTATPHGAKLLLVPDDMGVNVDAQATVEVAIHEPDYGIEEPLLGTLEKAAEAVHDVVDAAEATCF